MSVSSWVMRAGLVFVLALAAAPGASAQSFDVPEGFIVDRTPELDEGAPWRHLFTVRPADGPFAKLSALKLAVVKGQVEDPDAWLRARVSAEVGSDEDLRSLFDSPDSPFSDPAFEGLRNGLADLLNGLRSVAALPLKFCDGPRTGYNASGPFRELYCVFGAGPVRQYMVLRLQEVAGHWYYTEIRTMNERRLRHLLAIANSFRVDI